MSSLRREDQDAVLIVTDDGRGIAAAAAAEPTAYGLRGMRERLRMLDGSLTIAKVSADGGTRLIARCALPRPN